MADESGFERSLRPLRYSLLAVIPIPRFNAAIIKAKITKVQGDFKATKTAMDMYSLDDKTYPNDDAQVEKGRCKK